MTPLERAAHEILRALEARDEDEPIALSVVMSACKLSLRECERAAMFLENDGLAVVLRATNGWLIALTPKGMNRAQRLDGPADQVPPPITEEEANDRFRSFEFHPLVSHAAWPQFKDGHYAPAVLEAAKALNNEIRYKRLVDGGGNPLLPELDGAALMFRAFGDDPPRLVVADLSTQSGQAEQQGTKHLFAGAMLAIRNPRAHDAIVDTAQGALERLAFFSMLARIVERATYEPVLAGAKPI